MNFRAKVADKLRDELAGTARFDYDPNRPSDPVTKAWDQAQKSFKCCGVGKNEKKISQII